MTSTTVYSTFSDGTVITSVGRVEPLAISGYSEPHCFVCNRHTDHFAEHDDMVELGLATYSDSSLDVYPTDLFYTPLGQRMRAHLSDAIDEWCMQVCRQRVPLIKVAGYVRTQIMLGR